MSFDTFKSNVCKNEETKVIAQITATALNIQSNIFVYKYNIIGFL